MCVQHHLSHTGSIINCVDNLTKTLSRVVIHHPVSMLLSSINQNLVQHLLIPLVFPSCVYMCTCVHVYSCTRVLVYSCTCVHVYLCTCVHVCIVLTAYTHAHVCMSTLSNIGLAKKCKLHEIICCSRPVNLHQNYTKCLNNVFLL